MHELPTMYTVKKANTTAPRFMCSEGRTASRKNSEYCSSSPSRPIIPSGLRKSRPIKSAIRGHGAVKALSSIPATNRATVGASISPQPATRARAISDSEFGNSMIGGYARCFMSSAKIRPAT